MKMHAYIAILSILLATWSTMAQPYSIDQYTVTGGGTSTGGVFMLSGTAGEAEVGPVLTGGNFSLQSGFEPGVIIVPTPGAPTILLIRTDAAITLSWDLATTGFVLESAPSLTWPIHWTPVAGVISNSITLTRPAGIQFYRLRKEN